MHRLKRRGGVKCRFGRFSGLPVFFLFLPVLSATAQALPPVIAADQAEESAVLRTVDGVDIVLENGMRLVLSGIRPPGGGKAGSKFGKGALSRHLMPGGRVTWLRAANGRDRYNRVPAHLRVGDDGRWVNGALVREGLAYAFPIAADEAVVRALYALEDKARREGLGLWADGANAVQPARNISAPPGRFVLVDGVVRSAAKPGGTVYLNFGEDWRTDFTVHLDWPLRRQLAKARRGPDFWIGKKLRVRGVLGRYNGPMLRPVSPAQIEILAPADGS